MVQDSNYTFSGLKAGMELRSSEDANECEKGYLIIESNLAPGTYNVTITDANGYSTSEQYTVIHNQRYWSKLLKIFLTYPHTTVTDSNNCQISEW